MKKLLFASSIALLAMSTAAHARQWWVLNQSTSRCEIATMSPDEFNKGVRASDEFAGPPIVTVIRDDNGGVLGVFITVTYPQGNTSTLIWGATREVCLRAQSYLSAMQGGTLNSDELK